MKESDDREAPNPPDALSGGRPTKAPQVYHCDLCGAVMTDVHCKLICERCGYKRDCSDP